MIGEVTAIISKRQQDMISKIPVFKTGPKKGQARNDGLRELDRRLHAYSFSNEELDMIEMEITNQTPRGYFDAE